MTTRVYLYKRNQLHIILAIADLLKEQFPESEEATQFSENIIKSCKNSADFGT